MFGWVNHTLCVVLIFGWNVTKTLMMRLGWCVVCVCCVLFGWGMQRAGGHVVGLWGNRHCVLFFLLLFLFVNSGREHLMNDRRDCLLLCVIWFAARLSVVSV